MIALAVAVFVAAGFSTLVVRFYVSAQPDEWLLRLRNGRLVTAGVGITFLRRPGDVVVRFTSTLQRVSFIAEALSNERLAVRLEGFILWGVASGEDRPFRAFQKLGLVNLDAAPRDLRSPKHLLSTPQHKAFQQLLTAATQRLASTRSLETLLLEQDALVKALRAELASLETTLGIRIEQVELTLVRPTDEALTRQLAARVEESVRESAARVKLESEVRLAEERAVARQSEAERETAERLAQVEHERTVAAKETQARRERTLAEEATALDAARARLEREEADLAARLDRVRREAEAQRDAIAAVAHAEGQKSQAVRDAELSKLVAEKVAEALKALPLRDAKWISVGADSPAQSLAGLFAAVRAVAVETGEASDRPPA